MTIDAHEALCHALDDDEVPVDGEDGQAHSPEQLSALLQSTIHASTYASF